MKLSLCPEIGTQAISGLRLFFVVISLVLLAVPREAAALDAFLESCSSQNFPFIFLNVRVEENGVPVTQLTQDNFQCFENGNLQTDLFNVTPPQIGGGVRLADIVFLIDSSGSMGLEIADVRNNVSAFAAALAASDVDFRLGLVRFGNSSFLGPNPFLFNDGILTSDVDLFQSFVNSLAASGAFEPGFLALRMAAQGFNFRPGSQRVFIIITDEDSDDRDKQTAIDLLTANDITVHAAANCFQGSSQTDYCDDSSVRAATGGLLFNVIGPYDQILDTIVATTASTYVLRYRSSNQDFDNTLRAVECNVTTDTIPEDSVSCSYTPGAAPIIELTPATEDLNETALVEGSSPTIEAVVTDLVAPFVESGGVRLFFRTSGTNGAYDSTIMSPVSGNIFGASIPSAQTPGVDYFISATDGEVTSFLPSTDAGEVPFQIAVLPNEKPVILHEPIVSAIPSQDLKIGASITDTTNSLANAEVKYRRVGELSYTSIGMQLVGGNEFEATIPGDDVTGDIEYLVRATDDLNLSATIGTEDDPLVVALGGPSLSLSKTSLDFGVVVTTSTTQTISLTNTGNVDLVLGTLNLSGSDRGDFALVDNNCDNLILLPNANCSFSVVFTPTAFEPRRATITVPSDAANGPQRITLTGGPKIIEPTPPPSLPTGLTGMLGQESAVIFWDAPPEPVSGWEVEIKQPETTTFTIVPDPTTETGLVESPVFSFSTANSTASLLEEGTTLVRLRAVLHRAKSRVSEPFKFIKGKATAFITEKPEFPVLFLHGIPGRGLPTGGGNTWNELDFCAEGWQFGGFITVDPKSTEEKPQGEFHSPNFGSLTGPSSDQLVGPLIPLINRCMTSPQQADFFIAGFRNNTAQYDNRHGLYNWAVELEAFLKTLRGLTGKSKFIIVAHSAGGIAARLYIQPPSATFPAEAPAPSYNNDVAHLVTFGTPHGGIEVDKIQERIDDILNTHLTYRSIIGPEDLLTAKSLARKLYGCLIEQYFRNDKEAVFALLRGDLVLLGAKCSLELSEELIPVFQEKVDILKSDLELLASDLAGLSGIFLTLAEDIRGVPVVLHKAIPQFAAWKLVNSLADVASSEAFIQLNKGSDFLAELNQRLAPLQVKFTSILGGSEICSEIVFPGLEDNDCVVQVVDQNFSNILLHLHPDVFVFPPPGKCGGFVNAIHSTESSHIHEILVAVGSDRPVFCGASPINLEITDPDGLQIAKDFTEIPGALYQQIKPLGSADSKILVGIPFVKPGEYRVSVTPKESASPTDTFSLEVTRNGMTTILAEDEMIQDVPIAPYVFFAEPGSIPGDLDNDGDIDRDDLNILLAARNTPATGPDDPRDLDGNGTIDALDARKLTLLCTRPRCATE